MLKGKTGHSKKKKSSKKLRCINWKSQELTQIFWVWFKSEGENVIDARVMALVIGASKPDLIKTGSCLLMVLQAAGWGAPLAEEMEDLM